MQNYYDWDEVPLVLNAKDVKNILGLSRGKTYELMNSVEFPTLSEGKRMFVTKEAFQGWLNGKRRNIKRTPIIVERRAIRREQD